MHIGIVTSEFPPDIGGVEIYAAEFAKSLVTLGYDVTVFVHTHHNIEISMSGITLCPVLKFCRRLDRDVLKQYDVDAWHVMNAAHSWLALETDKPVVVSIHGNDFLNPYPLIGTPALASWGPLWRYANVLEPLERWIGKKLTSKYMREALPKLKAILANSQYTEHVFLENFPECVGKTLVAQVGVSDNFLATSPKDNNNDITQFLTVSRLSEPRKNIGRVIEALSQLSAQFDFCYTIIGDGTFKASLEMQVENLGLENKVKFHGRQTTENVITAMRQADLFILPSSTLPDSHEGFGIVYLEAAACGTPSLATRQAGAIEAIRDGESGFFVEEPTVENIKDALLRFLKGDMTFNTHTCRHFSEQFTWQRVVEKALPFYMTEKSS
ncbi:MAG: glycosyltransferase family 4 protein [Methylococcales bacterium]